MIRNFGRLDGLREELFSQRRVMSFTQNNEFRTLIEELRADLEHEARDRESEKIKCLKR